MITKWMPQSLKTTTCAIIATLLPGTAFAGSPSPPSISLSPLASSIPTLGNAMLILLALFLAVVAVRILRTNPAGGNRMSAVALVAGLMAVAAGGTVMVEGVRALNAGAPPSVTLFDQEGGGTVVLEPTNNDFLAQVANTTSVSQQVTAINPGFCSLEPINNAGLVLPQLPEGSQEAGTCEVGLVIPSGDYCAVEFFGCPLLLPNGGGEIE